MKILNIAVQLRSALEQTRMPCFLCFGTLLTYIRDKKFSVDGDIDIGIITDNPQQAIDVLSRTYIPTHKVVDDVTGEIFTQTFKTQTDDPINIDVFFWKKKDGCYWHTFDATMSNNGDHLSQYTFKGVPTDCFFAPQEEIKQYQLELSFGRMMTNFGTWSKLLPQMQTEGVELPLPYQYGRCLDIWYPDWVQKRPQFGTSRSPHQFTVKTCKDISWEK